MKDTYRERIKEEQKKLSPSQVFFSEGYRKLFRDLANEVAGEKLEQLLLYQSTEDGLAGWNDGKRIGINIGNLITGSFLELEQKSDSLIGILGHECGHARFTDSALRKVYVQNMLAGVWYPDAPEPENEDEEKALNEMDTCLAGKNPVVVPLLTECAAYISNLLNDVYIEEKMCSLFPGSIKKGILINRRRNVEWIPPLKELLEGNSDPVSVFLKVLVQYALRGYANSWNMERCEMLDTLNEVKQFVDLSVTADSDRIRYQATNQILLKMWKYFRNLLEELKQECQEPEENEEERSQEEETSEAELSEEEQSEKEPKEMDEPQEEHSQKEQPQEESAEEKSAGEETSTEEDRKEASQGEEKSVGEDEEEETEESSTGEKESKEEEPVKEGDTSGDNNWEASKQTGDEESPNASEEENKSETVSEKASSEEKSKEAVGGKEGLKDFSSDSSDEDLPTDVSGNGKDEAKTGKQTEELTEEQLKKLEAAMGEYLKELTEDLPKFIQESEVDETALPELENATVVQVSKEDKEEREGADEKSDLILQKILLDLVSETVDQDMGVEAQNRLQEELDGMEFEAAHNMVKKEVLYKNTFTETEKSWLSAYEASARKVEKRLRTRLLPILENQKERTERRMYLGKKLDMRAIADPGGAVYKRIFPGKKTDAVVCVLVDNSGSMIGHRIEAAKVAALTLYDFCRQAGIPILVYGHHTDGYEHCDPSEETVYFHSYAEFEEDRNDRLRIVTMENDGSNRDGAALLFMANKLLKRPEKQKLLFLISDGLPNATRYFGSYATADLKKIKEKLGKKGILFQAAAIGWDKEAIRKIYGNAYLDISSLEQLPIRLTKQLAKLLRRVN